MNKVIVLLSVFLVAVTASARVGDEAVLKDSLELIDFTPERNLRHHLPRGVFYDLDGNYNPEDCLPYIKPAYETAVEVRRIFGKGRELVLELREEVMNCFNKGTPEEMNKCLEDLKQVAITKGKALLAEYMKVRPTVLDLFSKFYDCMDKPWINDRVTTYDARKCFPHLEEGYNTASAFYRLVNDALEVLKWLYVDYMNCEAQENAESKSKCLHSLMKKAFVDVKPIIERYRKLRPQIDQVMEKFKTCLGA